jgi:beta-glucosidase
VSAEGAAPASTWARWEDRGRAPRSGEGNAFLTNYGRDFPMMAELGIGRHRMTLEWARIEPQPGKVDGEAVERYLEILRTARGHGVQVWAELCHVSLPGWFADDEHGFGDDHARTYFWTRHVDRVAELFHDLVEAWVPFHAPMAFARGGWQAGGRPPGRQDDEAFAEVLRAVQLASLDAWRLLRSGDRPVATAIDLSLSYPAVRTREPDERDAAADKARTRTRIVLDNWVEGLREGLVHSPGLAPVVIPDLAGAFEIIGFVYEDARSVYADGSTDPYPADARVDAAGAAPWPEGLGVVLRHLHEQLPGRRLLPEVSVATPATDPRQDEWRAELIRGWSDEIDRAVDDGIDVIGCFHDTLVDGYEWEDGVDVLRGVVDRDRRPKPSATVLAERSGA